MLPFKIGDRIRDPDQAPADLITIPSTWQVCALSMPMGFVDCGGSTLSVRITDNRQALTSTPCSGQPLLGARNRGRIREEMRNMRRSSGPVRSVSWLTNQYEMMIGLKST